MHHLLSFVGRILFNYIANYIGYWIVKTITFLQFPKDREQAQKWSMLLYLVGLLVIIFIVDGLIRFIEML
ncbi:MAG: hypothetical protein U9N49_01635 [Campylobacterota bacterium]|nr:hypothetical protein [Campylobacterota bacterium]